MTIKKWRRVQEARETSRMSSRATAPAFVGSRLHADRTTAKCVQAQADRPELHFDLQPRPESLVWPPALRSSYSQLSPADLLFPLPSQSASSCEHTSIVCVIFSGQRTKSSRYNCRVFLCFISVASFSSAPGSSDIGPSFLHTTKLRICALSTT